MLASNRVIWNDNGTLKDLSTKLNNFFSETQVIDFVAAQDKLYIGSDVPFNHRFISVSVPNSSSSVASVDIWDGDDWEPAVDVIDQTSISGVTLAQNGILSWATDRNKTWAQEVSTEKMDGSGLETLKIYNMYWVRINLSANILNTTALKYIGHKFSKDEDLGGYYPDLNRSTVKTAFAAGKTTWDDQHIMAAEEVFRDLRKKKAAWAKGQIFEWEPFTAPAVHKVAQIVYTAFGEDYEGRRDEAQTAYDNAMEGVLIQGIDGDADGHIGTEEHAGSSITLRRV